jgi:hypothetical protein
VFGGAGVVAYRRKHFTWVQEAYFLQGTGPAAKGARHILPWTLLGYSIPRTKLVGDAEYFTYLPLNQPARIQYVLDRAKLEYEFRRYRIGGGYAAYKYADGAWENKPFLTFTVKAQPVGSFEFWAQRLQTNAYQLQVRYVIGFK